MISKYTDTVMTRTHTGTIKRKRKKGITFVQIYGVQVHTSKYTDPRARTHTHTKGAHTHARTVMHTLTRTRAHALAHTHTHPNTPTRPHTYTTRMHTFTSKHTHPSTYTFIHTHMHAPRSCLTNEIMPRGTYGNNFVKCLCLCIYCSCFYCR